MTIPCVCPQCGKPVPSDGPQGLCPACLLKAALPGQSALEAAATGFHDSSSATTTVPEAGVRVKYFGDYELLEEIARGGMGVVWKARQTSLKRDVALKMIRAGALASPDEVQRFLREAEAAANLQHPNIVAIHEVGEHDGQHYFSMDYVPGRDLGALVKDGPLEPQVAARYVKIIAEAIHFAHQRGTLHRDLKPQNVLIDTADQPRITDFGLAKFIKDDSRLTQSGVVMGSPSYMPPEQADGRHSEVGPASDVYSLGAVLYELLTGRPPFRGTDVMATLRDVMENEPAAPRRLKADIPPDLETICLKCLEKSPTVRYPTARALAEELDRFLKGEPIQARPASAVRKVVSWARRHPGVLTMAAAAVMVALTFGVFYLIEENAYLRAKAEDPTLTRLSHSERQERLNQRMKSPDFNKLPEAEQKQLIQQVSEHTWFIIKINLFALLALVAGMFVFAMVEGRARALSFKEWLNPFKLSRPIQPLGERTRALAIGAGLVLVGCGVAFLVTVIKVHVWEGASLFGEFLPIMIPILLIFFGLWLLGLVIRDYRLVNYGPSTTPNRQLTAEQIESIRSALEDYLWGKYNWLAAVKCYRKAVPDAGWLEARQYVFRLADSLTAQGKFDPPPLSLATLNWMDMGIWAAIEAIIFAVAWFVEPPLVPAMIVLQFAYGFLGGMLLIACLRARGLWKLLPLVSVLAMFLLFPVVLTLLVEDTRDWSVEVTYPDNTVTRHPFLTQEESFAFSKKVLETEKFQEVKSGGSGVIRFGGLWYPLGTVCGCWLMAVGFTGRPRKGPSKP
jgi:serine/threonine protein kinase